MLWGRERTNAELEEDAEREQKTVQVSVSSIALPRTLVFP